MDNLWNFTIEELEEVVISLGEPKYRAKQLFDWLHNKLITDIFDASNISKEFKNKLSENFDIKFPEIYKEYISKLDDTKKYLVKLNDGNIIETVLMKYNYGYSICISTQVGCNMGCKFCASTIGGLVRNLYAYEMLSQIYLVSRHNDIKISNIVLMGSGEPLLNFDNVHKLLKMINSEFGQNISLRNITISTCGIIEGINKLKELDLPITLALSLHAPNDDIRNKIMPISKKYALNDVVKCMADYFEKTNRRITFEYSLIHGINDGNSNAHKLIELFKTNFDKRHIDFNINLIPVNEIKESEFKRPDEKHIYEFKKVLEDNGLNVTIRRELGKDISGSCGQLRANVR